VSDILADIDSILGESSATLTTIAEDHYTEAMDSVRDLLDGSSNVKAAGMYWSSEARTRPSLVCGDCCDCVSASQQAWNLPLIGGSFHHRDGRSDDHLSLLAAGKVRTRSADAIVDGFSRHEVVFAGLPPNLAWSPLSDVIPAAPSLEPAPSAPMPPGAKTFAYRLGGVS
jgi:hypothetical protein